jgi:hypothetical protein
MVIKLFDFHEDKLSDLGENDKKNFTIAVHRISVFFGCQFFWKSLHEFYPIRKTEGGSIFFFQDGRQMSAAQNYERLARTISALSRNEVEKKIKNFRGRFRLDFTDEYLNGTTVDRLRHILFAAMTTKFKKLN